MADSTPYYLLYRFIDTRHFFSKVITWDTNSLFSHTEIGVLADPTNPASVTGWLGAHLHGGVEVRPLGYCSPFRDFRYAVPVTRAQYNKAMTYYHAQVGTRYGVLTCVGLGLKIRRLHSPGREICSQLMIGGTQAADLSPLNVAPSYDYLVTPDMFHLWSRLAGCRIMAKGMPK